MEEGKIYVPKEGEKILTFVRRIIAEQPNPEPLHIVGQLVEIVVSELKGRKCQATVEVSTKSLTVTNRHERSEEHTSELQSR